MKHVTLQLSRAHRTWLYSMFAAVFLTGACWILFHHFLPVEGEFGIVAHPSERWWLRFHGAAAFVFLFGLGTVLPNHIQRAWQTRKNRHTGVTFCAVNAILIASGYLLYYFSGEDSRAWISASHWIVGTGLPVFVLWHVWAGRRSRLASRSHS
jgi:hypothetical protein